MATVIDTTTTLREVRGLYGRGLYLQAREAGSALGEFRDWPGTEGQILAGRLIGNLGGRRQAAAMMIRTWRADPTDAEACYYYVYSLFTQRGAFEALRAHQTVQHSADATIDQQADWLALRANIYAVLRDFDSADEWFARAMKLGDRRAWLWVEKSHILELEDRHADALQAAEHALELRPWYRPGVQAAAHLLLQANRDQDALELLLEATERMESGAVLMQLAQLQTELQLHEEARRSWEQAAEFLPFVDKQHREYLLARRCDAAYEGGDIERCMELAGQLDRPFFKSLLENLKVAPADAKRVRLPVGFVRQHHVTCVPATLTAISGYWNMPADHLSIAEEICYDGTPAHSERRWAEKNGYVAREFKVTWEAAVALLDRGVPFTLTSVEPGNAHMQAVVGYDARRRTLLIREPSFRLSGESLADPMLERYAAIGPRGMALAPQAKADLLAGLELPEAELYDQLYRLELALQTHQRAEAARECDALQAQAPGHRLTLVARQTLAAYDANPIELLATVEQKLQLFPNDAVLRLQKLGLLSQLAKRDDRIQLLETIIADAQADPLFWLQYADEFLDDARQHPRLAKLLKKTVRFRPQLAGAYHDLARILWIGWRRDEALEAQRLAACLNDKEERYPQSYFVLSRYLGRTDEALKMLRGRFERYAGKSSLPARTLCWALFELDRTAEAQAVIQQSLERRPDDGDMLLYAADLAGRFSDFDEATKRLEQAKGCSHGNYWRRVAADLALYRGDKVAARDSWRKILDAEPIAADAHRTYARLLAETEGIESAITHVRTAVEQFPHHYRLNQLLLDWLRDEHDIAAWHDATVRMVESFPADVWVRRELCAALARLRQFGDSVHAAEVARDLDPSDSWSWSTLGYALGYADRRDEAHEALKQAVRLSIDNDTAMTGLLNQCHSVADRREAIVFIYEELCRQITLGDGLIAWREHAETLFDGYTLLHVLFEALQARPDLWQAWSAVVTQLCMVGSLDRALKFAQQATERFPLLPRVWLDLADVHRRRLDAVGERDALERALRINSRWSVPMRRLSNNYEREQNFVRAAELLEQAVHHDPLDSINHGCLASVLWKLGRREEAFDRLRIALRLDPGYEWAWTSMSKWGKEVGQPNRASEVAGELTKQRPAEARSWMMLAQVHVAAGEMNEALPAVEKAVELNPRLMNAHDLRARLLADSGRFDEAAAAARPAFFGDDLPLELRGRSAWVEAHRGNVRAAIEQMEKVVRDSPEYWFGLEQLGDWYEQLQEWDDYARIAQRMVEVAPHYSVSYGYRGFSRMKAGDRDGAKADFRRAIQYDPDYVFAALSLYDLLLEQDELEEAAHALAIVKAHAPSEFVTAREVQLAARRDDRQTATELLALLCRNRDTGQWAIRTAWDAVCNYFGRELAELELQKWINDADAHPEVPSLLVESLIHRNQWRRARKVLKQSAGNGDAWRRAAVSYLQALAKLKQTPPITRFVRRNWDRLQAETWTWGYVVEVLSDFDLHRLMLKWCRDWRSRRDLQPRMLFFYAMALRYRNADDQALEVNRFAATLPPDATFPAHRLWILVEEILQSGTPSDAAGRLAEIDSPSLAEFYRGVLSMAKQLAEMSAPSARAISYRDAKRQVIAAASQEVIATMNTHAAFRRLRHRICAKLASDRGNTWLAGWHRFAARVVAYLPRLA